MQIWIDPWRLNPKQWNTCSLTWRRAPGSDILLECGTCPTGTAALAWWELHKNGLPNPNPMYKQVLLCSKGLISKKMGIELQPKSITVSLCSAHLFFSMFVQLICSSFTFSKLCKGTRSIVCECLIYGISPPNCTHILKEPLQSVDGAGRNGQI